VAEPKHATHADPVWHDRTNFIIQVDLEPHGMPSGSYEQLWTRTRDQGRYEVCCIPFFTYGIALGDVVVWNDADRRARIVEPSGRQVIRVAFNDPAEAVAAHEEFHADLLSTHALVEFRGAGYAAVDIDSDERLRAVLDVVDPLQTSGRAIWEWGSQTP
jgi:hypothetical protein